MLISMFDFWYIYIYILYILYVIYIYIIYILYILYVIYYIYIYIYTYDNHKTLISQHGCSYNYYYYINDCNWSFLQHLLCVIKKGYG